MPPKAPKPPNASPPEPSPADDARSEEERELDQALADSFPASDPVSQVTPDSGAGAPPRRKDGKPGDKKA